MIFLYLSSLFDSMVTATYVYDFNSQNRDFKYSKIPKLSLPSPYLGSFFNLFKINNSLYLLVFFMSIAGQCGSYMPALLVTIP